MVNSAADMINLDRYPIASPERHENQLFAQQCRQQYQQTGLCILPDFINPQAQAILSEEANSISHQAYFCQSTHNAYLTEHDPSLDTEDVAHRQEQTFVGSVAYDLIAEDAFLRRLYLWDPLKDFIAYVLGKEKLYRFADPLGACSINVFVEGGEHGWHFDESEFTVTLMLQAPQSGGSFEYVPQIRGTQNEKAIVSKVLDGDRSGVFELPFTPGTLLIFGGQQTIHRVTRISGTRARLVPVLCYSEQENLQNSDAVRKLFWGRTGYEAAL